MKNSLNGPRRTTSRNLHHDGRLFDPNAAPTQHEDYWRRVETTWLEDAWDVCGNEELGEWRRRVEFGDRRSSMAGFPFLARPERGAHAARGLLEMSEDDVMEDTWDVCG